MMYSSWETDKIIVEELVRNVSLAMVAVFFMTLILIAHLLTSVLVFFCVAMTLVRLIETHITIGLESY